MSSVIERLRQQGLIKPPTWLATLAIVVIVIYLIRLVETYNNGGIW